MDGAAQPLLGTRREASTQGLPAQQDLVEEAAALAERLLGGDAERLAHSAAVAERAQLLSATVPVGHRPSLVAAAWLHDIGYAASIEQSGFHPVDGARHLRQLGWPTAIQQLVAHHSGSRFVAAVRRLECSLHEFAFIEDELSDAVTTADQTVGPGGRSMTVEERLADMLHRHGPSSPNAQAHARRQPYLIAAAERVADRMRARGMSPEHHRICMGNF